MADTPTWAIPPSFLGVRRTDRDARFVVAGVPLDIGTTNRSGARDGPAAIRRASRMLVDGDHPTFWIDPGALELSDIGDFPVALGDIPASLRLIEQAASGIEHLLSLGGEHGITLPRRSGWCISTRMSTPGRTISVSVTLMDRCSTTRSRKAWWRRIGWCRSESDRRCSVRCGIGPLGGV
jgi:hypothetical protein